MHMAMLATLIFECTFNIFVLSFCDDDDDDYDDDNV